MTVNTAASFIRDTDASWTASQFTKATEGLTAAFWDPSIFCRRTNSTVRNSLPNHLRDPAVDFEQLRRDLKTYLFAVHSKR